MGNQGLVTQSAVINLPLIVGAGAVAASTAADLALRGIDHLLIGRGE